MKAMKCLASVCLLLCAVTGTSSSDNMKVRRFVVNIRTICIHIFEGEM